MYKIQSPALVLFLPLFLPLSVLLAQPNHVISTGGGARRRSGETRFSTHTLPSQKPVPHPRPKR